MTEMQTPTEAAEAPTGAPPGFTLDAEASRPDAVVPGIVARAIELEPDDDEVEAAAPDDADDEDDDAIEDPDDTAPIDDTI